MIHITEKQTGKILDYIPLGDFWDDNHHKSLKDTLEYFEFRTFGDQRYSQYLEKMNRIIIPDEDGTYIEFVIFHAIKYRLQNAVVVDVYAPASYLLLKKAKVIKPQRVSEYTASQHLGFALNGTEWRPGIVESDKYRTIDIENHTNPYAYIKRIANEFELEPRFRVETDGNKVIGRYVDLLERVGQWQGREVEFGRDLLGIERKVDDSNVVTALIGLGPERDDGTRLEVMVEDEEALQRWGIPNPQTGELMHLIETYEPESTDQDMTIARLTELTRNELEKRINSVVEYTADVVDLEKVPGMENKVIRFGDTIKIKDVGFNPPLYLEARVHTQDRSLSQPEKKKITLGDFIEYTEEEVHAIWKQLQAEIAKKVSMAEVTEVVYTKPEVDERDDLVREHADNVAENAKREAIQVAAEDASQKAKQAEDSAKEYTDGRLENTVAKDIFESTVTDLLNNIAQKVDSTRFEQVESELRGIAEDLQHEVAEHAEALEEHGGKITKLETDVDEVAGKINATISELEALGDTVSRHETQIDANAREIALKADKQELDLLSGTVSDISSELSVMAGKIEAKADRSEVEKLESDVSKVSQDVSKLTVDVDGIKTNVGSISQTVSNHGTQISNINSTLTQHADMIATKVEKSEFDSVTNTLGNRISTIEQTADSISLEVSDIKANVYTKSEVDSAIGGIQVGGRNLIRNSNFGSDDVLDHWDFWGNSISMSVENHYGYNFLKVTSKSNMRGEYYWFRRRPQEFKLVKGVKYTLSWIQVMSEGTEDPRVVIRERSGQGYQQMLSNFQTETILRAEVYGSMRNFVKYSTTFELSDSIHESTLDIAWRFKNTRDGQEWVMISEPKLEKGNKATDWTPAPEDIDAQIADIEGTLASHSTKIEQNAQQIQLRATKTEVDALSGQVSSIQSQLTVMAEEISAKVEKDGIINAINISTEEIKISGTKLHITAQTTIDNAVIKDAHIDKMSATKLTAGTINADLITISNDKVTINTSGVSVKDGDFIMIDGVTGANYSMTPKTNLIKDHSFETLQPTGSVGNDDFFAIADVLGSQWTKIGNPRLATSEGREAGNTEAIYGNQAVVVNNANYVEYAMPYVRLNRGITYTISLYAKKAIAYTAGIPRIYLYVYNENISNGSKTTLWSTTLTANMAPPTDYRAVRFVFNFTMPNLTSNIDTYTRFAVRVLSANSNWVIVDGVQLVEGSSAGPYDAENSFFDFMNGYLPVRRLNSTGEIIARGWVYTDAIDSNPYSAGVHLYGRPTASGEFRVTTTGTTSTYRPIRALLAYVNGIDVNTGTNMYIRPASNGVARVTSTGTTETYRPIEASSFNQRSLEKDKTKIELFTDSALKIIRQTDIYKYQMKSDVEVGQGKDRYGVVIGDGYNTPDEFLSYDRTSVDLYSEASIAIKAIQELDTEQQELKGRIAWLEAENKLLREKIKKLEGMIE